MNYRQMVWCLLAAAGCSSPRSNPEISLAEDQRALAITEEYKIYGRVDDELRWAPYLCRQPMPGTLKQSESKDATTHGQKLYSVFAKDHESYPDRSQVGQVIVKESFKAEAVANGTVFDPGSDLEKYYGPDRKETDDHLYPYARKGEQVFRAGDPAGLFIMYKVADGTPNTDEGWIYATVSPERQVTASGRIESCMGCHENAPHGRLFGVPVAN